MAAAMLIVPPLLLSALPALPSAEVSNRTAARPVAPPRVLVSPFLSLLLVNRELRGRDQRHSWVRTVAALHPAWRVGLASVAVAFVAARGGWGDNTCAAFRASSVLACAAAVEYGAAVTIAATALSLLIFFYLRDERAESRDYGLTELYLAAAASSAAYAPVGGRVAELLARGVESSNWVEDTSLSSEVVAVLYNRHTQTCIVAFRGTITLGDWSSNFKTILPGREESSRTFRESLELARAAQFRYAFVRRLRLTGHSRGGTMADFCGRRLGLPSIQINPGMGVSSYRVDPFPAVSSVTARSADVISIMEAVHAMDRQVLFRWPTKSFQAAGVHLGLLLLSAALALLATKGWLRTAGAIGAVGAVTAYSLWMHSVLRFTKR